MGGERVGNSTAAVDICRVMAEMETDQVLWARARAGDAEAFGTLFQRHAMAVYRLCFWRTGDVALAEDLSAAVFLETWRHKARVVAVDGSILPWLFGVASNLVRNHWRATRRREAALRRLPPLPVEPDVADEVVDRVASESATRDVLAVVRQLPERDQEVLALCGWAGCTYEEAARSLGVPVGTVRSRLARARARLGRLLAEADGSDDTKASFGVGLRKVREEHD
jgi:RNA polymerase sigma factor (sigma-70 family)